MIDVYDAATNALIGTITEADLQVLMVLRKALGTSDGVDIRWERRE